ncbi:MAG: HEAT repeat domain-containing protein [Ignavibacteriales bacterium]|nr:HEAT repeat domain-containing protein [Ignavibacteriales bacterium]
MRAANITKQLTKTLVFTLALVLLTGSISNGQTASAELKKHKRMIENLIIGIQSSNEGVKRECIYYAGKYEFTEAVDALIDILKSEKNPKDRALIALALYRIGDEKGIQAVYDAASTESDAKVKRTYNAIVAEYKAAKAIAANK